MDLRREPAPVRDVGLDIGYVFDRSRIAPFARIMASNTPPQQGAEVVLARIACIVGHVRGVSLMTGKSTSACEVR
jgi:hypothetical protein